MRRGMDRGLVDRPEMSEDSMARLPLRHDCCRQVRFGMGQTRLLAMVAICGLWLSGCASTPEAADAGPFPVKYREMAKDYLRKTLVDPYSVRDAEIAEPEVKSSFYFETEEIKRRDSVERQRIVTELKLDQEPRIPPATWYKARWLSP